MENDLADRIASRLKSGARARARQRLDARDRLKVWVTGRCLCDPDTAALIPDVSQLYRWHMMEGLGRISTEEAADLWATVLDVGDTVDLGLWKVGVGKGGDEDEGMSETVVRSRDWYYDCGTGKLYHTPQNEV